MSSSLHLLGNNLKDQLVLTERKYDMFDIVANMLKITEDVENGSGTGYFNYYAILRARKLNQRAKAQRRGCPTAGRTDGRWRNFHTGGTYISPERQEKKRQMRALNCSGKRLRRIKNAERRAA